jgi:PiT family inorganic phosphate transporter
MDPVPALAIGAIALALVFNYTNGFHDASNLAATIITSRAMTPRQAVVLVGTFEFIGPVVGGTAVASTVGSILRQTEGPVLVPIALAAIAAAILWNLLTWYYGIPSSSSHALIGGLVGAALLATRSTGSVYWGLGDFRVFHPVGVFGIAMTLLISPILGFIAGWMLQRLVSLSLRGRSPRANTALRRGQWFTAAALAFSHGTNDAQKTMGMIALLLLSGGWMETFHVPFWVKLSAALALSLGALSGGWRIMRTVGRGIFRVRPVHGFSSQTASAGVILGTALVGGPVSTTHVVSSAIAGVGSASKLKAVRWRKVKEIVLTWLITIPVSMLLSGIIFLGLGALFHGVASWR